MSLEVVAAGPRTLVQDLGRPGLGGIGVSTSGAFDRVAHHQANALVGDPDTSATLEVLGGGLEVRATSDHVVAVTGAVGPITLDGAPAAHGRPVLVRAGQVLRLGSVVAGLRSYVAVAGGIDAPTVLGSASRDTLAALGPQPLAVGDVVPIGSPGAASRIDDVPALLSSGEIRVGVVLGPRDDWFTAEALRLLVDTPWTVGSSSDRIGVRLDGPRLERIRDDELPSEPCVRGSIQVTADGRPIVLGPDHPVTGGYPVIAVVRDAHTDRLAQARPGDVVRLSRTPSP